MRAKRIAMILATLVTLYTISSYALLQDISGENAADHLWKLQVNYIDVGQGDSIFIELPNRKTMLIDAGNTKNGKEIVKYIKREGYDRVDFLVISHPHIDHIGGMPKVISDLKIGKVYMPKIKTDTRTFHKLIAALKSKGLKIYTAGSGIKIYNSGNLRVDFIAPAETSYPDLNDSSAVIKLTYGSKTFLFMGDAEKIEENQITADVSADVIKVGHHGFRRSTSKAFIRKVSPSYAVISVGDGYHAGHPSPLILDTLSKSGAEIYRTDRDGTVVFMSDGRNVSVTCR